MVKLTDTLKYTSCHEKYRLSYPNISFAMSQIERRASVDYKKSLHCNMLLAVSVTMNFKGNADRQMPYNIFTRMRLIQKVSIVSL